jgi:ribosomal protein S18 acetylase RimI-like enzyme
MEGYEWRMANEGDVEGLEALDAACRAVDGPASVRWFGWGEVVGKEDVSVLCGTADEEIVAVGWPQTSGGRVRLWGRVHPQHRRKTLGTHVLRWTEEEARRIGKQERMTIVNEALSDGSAALYEQEGYSCSFVEQWMQRELEELPEAGGKFQGEEWTKGNAGRFFATYRDAFSTRRAVGSEEPVAEEWIEEYVSDEDFRPDLSLLCVVDGEDAGFLAAGVMRIEDIGEMVGWVSQVGVKPKWRGRGVGAWLMGRAMEAFRRDGLGAVGLHVNVDNPGAIGLYEMLGFKVMGRRAVYSKDL